MRVTYIAAAYRPELVTGRYVRAHGSARKGYEFTVFECETGTGRYLRGPGTGATLREYVSDGAEIPEEIRERCIQSKTPQRWD